MKIHCTGREAEMKDISLRLYLKETCGYGLTQAEDITNMIMDNIPVNIYIPPLADIRQVLQELKEIGVICEVQQPQA